MTDVQTESHWTTGIAFDHRFGTLVIEMRNKDTDERLRQFVPLSEIMRQCGIHPDELRAYCQDAVNPSLVLGAEDITQARLRVLAETDWKGKVVLDVGGYDGFAAEIAHKSGASRAICLDNRQYDHYAANDPGYWLDVRKEGVEYVTGDFMDYSADFDSMHCLYGRDGTDGEGGERLPEPDVLIFYNVLYHLKNPWAALEKLHELVKPDGQMLLCTLFRYSDRPVWYYYDSRECNGGDESVFWGPSISGLERVLRDTGWTFDQEGLAMDRVVYRCWPTLPVAGRQSRV
jgi:SAM-dependent methyltransferase